MQPSDYVAASDGTGEAVRAIVTTIRNVGATTLLVDSVSHWPTKFIATSGNLDPLTGLLSTVTVFRGTRTGSIITITAFAPGYPDIGHTVGQVVVLKPSTLWADIVRQYLDDLSTFTNASTQVALVRNEVINGTKDGVNKNFSLNASAVTGSVELYKNGVRQTPGAGNDYTVAGVAVTMAVAPLAGTSLLADYATSTSQFTAPTTVGIRTNESVTGTINSTNKVFTTTVAYMPGTLEVWVNGLKQTPVTHYVETTPTSGIFTFDDAPLTGDNIMVNYQNSLSFAIGDADTVDTFHASPVAAANTILPLNSSAKYPATVVTGLEVADTGWVTPTLLNSWVAYGAPFATAGYRKDAAGYVHLRGLVRTGTVVTSIFVLPAGYRPAEQLIFSTNSSATTASRTDILTSGGVFAQTGANAYWSLDGIIFKAEA
jgi:hypothetical protein